MVDPHVKKVGIPSTAEDGLSDTEETINAKVFMTFCIQLGTLECLGKRCRNTEDGRFGSSGEHSSC